jgi:hypothetical protein
MTARKYTRRDGKRFAQEGECPSADIRFDKFSGCDFYCSTCGARHWDECKLPPAAPVFMYGQIYQEQSQ